MVRTDKPNTPKMFVDFTLENTCEDLGGDLEGMASELRESEGEGDRTAYELKVIL